MALIEIKDEGLLFFTQRITRKVSELNQNPVATFTFWFELLQREVIVEGIVEALTELENREYWKNYPREAQIRFHAYAPTSSKPIASIDELENKREKFRKEWENKEIPFSSDYYGFRVKLNRFAFYTYKTPALSEHFEFNLVDGRWQRELLSP